MKNSFIISDIRRDLLRRLIMPLLVTASAVMVLQLFPRENVFHQRPLNYKSHYENFYNRFLPCVHVTASDLYYTGFDRTAGGKVTGHYYYTLVDGYCQFYLLNAGAGSPPPARIDSLDLHGRLIELDSHQYDKLTAAMASSLGWKTGSLRKITAPYAVASYSLSFFVGAAGRLAVNICLLAGLAELFRSLICLAFPLASLSFRYLGSPKEALQKISEAEAQLHSQNPVKTGKLYLTESYLLYLDGTATRLLPLEILFWGGKTAGSKPFLCLAASDGKFMRFPCPSSEGAELMLSALIRSCPTMRSGKRPGRKEILSEMKIREKNIPAE